MKYWDLRASNNQAVASLDLKERVHCMDVKGALCVVGTADRQLHIINLQQPTSIFRSIESPLKYQSRSVACFSDQQGYCVGGVEGRVGVVNITETASKKNFQFKCHREGKDNNDVYSVNSIVFHEQQGTFATAGSDGTYVFWDKDAKSRLKQFNKHPNAITTSVFSPNGNMYAYAIGYDYSKGYSEYNAHKLPCEIHIHPVQAVEVAKKPR
jgi:mRNA export factor